MAEHKSVWSALYDDMEQAENLRIRSGLMIEIAEYLHESGFTQKQASEKLGISQPRLSNILNGKIDKFTIDTLVNILARTGAKVEISVNQPVVTKPTKKSWVGGNIIKLFASGKSNTQREPIYTPDMVAIG